ncbi:MAG: endonuclease domain-containing protein [Nocardioidaceae bacterium]
MLRALGGCARRPELKKHVSRGAAVVRARVGMLDARAANAFESCCRAILLGAGITGFQPQLTIRHKRQWVGRVDLAHRRLRIVIECDGFATHGTLDAMRADCIRHTRLVAAGWRPLRFTWDQVMFEPAWVLELVEDTIALAHGTAPAAA